ncbi:polysaccharide lyase family 7 protein [Aquimarina sp. LLG6339-5]|uniref:polysaccharide lyase family 7 protein n=1 Tax=Aquimarina sp. LLG6339-5 TaxID=3160830 RepID=UPI003867B091
MKKLNTLLFQTPVLISILALFLNSCFHTNATKNVEKENTKTTVYPSNVIPFMDEWTILTGDGTRTEELANYEQKDFFYVSNDGETDWVVYKTPNSGITSKNSSNTRTELGQKKHWIPETGGKLSGTLKVMHVSTSGDARVAASYSVVVGQIHSDDGHENEPLKIFYKKFPGHTKGSVFWNYEINTEGDNSKRWDYSTAVWGNDMSTIGSSPTAYPEEPNEGVELGEEFSYEVNVYNGIMHLTFASKGHPTKTFTKNLLKSEFISKETIPKQILTLYAAIGRDGTERTDAYAGELQFFKQGAYNQTNGKNPEDNIVWNTGSKTYDGDIAKQYANGCYAEVWFKEATVGSGTEPDKE